MQNCSYIFDSDSVERCYNELFSYTSIGAYEGYIIGVFKEQDYFRIEMMFIDDFTEYGAVWEAKAYFDEAGSLKLSFINNQQTPYNSIEEFMWIWKTELLDNQADDNAFCPQFFDDNSLDTCYGLKSLFRDNSYTTYLSNYLLNSDSPWIEFELTSPNEPSFYLHLDVQFIINPDTNEIKIDIINQYQMFPLDDFDWDWLLNDLISNLNNPTYPEQDFCDIYFSLFEDCTMLKNDVLNGDYIELVEWYPNNANSMWLRFSVTNENTWKNEFTVVIKAYYDVNGDINITGYHDAYSTTISVEEAKEAFESLLQNFIDPSLTNDMLYMFTSPQALGGREFYLTDNTWSASLIDLTYLQSDGYTYLFEANILLIHENDQLNRIIHLQANKLDDGTIWFFLENTTIDPNLLDIASFITSFNDHTIDSQSFCQINLEYFDPICFELRDMILTSGWSLDWDGSGLDPYTGFITLNIKDETGELITTIELQPYAINNILGDTFIEYKLSSETMHNDLLIHLTPLISDLLDSWLYQTLEYICQDQICEGDFLDMSQSVQSINLIEIFPEDYLISDLWVTNIELLLSDQTNLLLTVDFNVQIDADQLIDVIVRNMYFSTNTNYFPDLLTQEETIAVMQQYSFDLLDESLSDDTFCTWYFGDPTCMPERSQLFGNATFNVTFINATVDENNVPLYWFTFTTTIDDITEEYDVALRVHYSPMGTYYIEFIDQTN